jgi:hypothetical protein
MCVERRRRNHNMHVALRPSVYFRRWAHVLLWVEHTAAPTVFITFAACFFMAGLLARSLSSVNKASKNVRVCACV